MMGEATALDRPRRCPVDLQALRHEVRSFLAEEAAAWSLSDRVRSWMSFDRGFSQRLGARGFIGMTWPSQFGGGERTLVERLVVTEELLAAGAPVAAHWIADRQSGPLLLRFGSEVQQARWLPRIVRGEVSFCIGMSEPDAGSDLSALRTRARPTDNGWRLTGTKLWATFAHRSDAMIALVRTSGNAGDRHAGLSQMLVDLTLPGITIRPIRDLTGEAHFNEVVFEDVELEQDALIGEEGQGWKQVTAELALERSGPERFLSSFLLLEALVRHAQETGDPTLVAPLGELVARLWTLRAMSRQVVSALEEGLDPMVPAAIVKDLGTQFEQDVPSLVQGLVEADLRAGAGGELEEILALLVQLAPSFSLRGGTREVLRGIIARGLGTR